jgi:hypothetical protein
MRIGIIGAARRAVADATPEHPPTGAASTQSTES